MKRRWLAGALGLGLLFLLPVGVQTQEKGKGFLWDGNFWGQISMDAKLGYVGGICNLADFEMAASKGKTVSISRAFAEELKDKTPVQIVQEIDRWYRENPEKRGTSVIEVMLRQCTTVCPPELKEGGKK